jgi:hypothetical protein
MKNKYFDLVKNILWDRSAEKTTILYSPDKLKNLDTSTKQVLKIFDSLGKEEMSQVGTNLHFLEFFNAHKGATLRILLNENPESPLVKHLRNLELHIKDGQRWVESLTRESPSCLKMITNEDDLFMYIMSSSSYGEIHTVRELLDSMTPQVIASYIKTASKPFSQALKEEGIENVRPEHLCTIINRIRQEENGPLMKKAQYVRAEFINYLLTHAFPESIFSQDQKPIILDSNGLFIQIKGLSTHLPYGFIDENTLEKLSDFIKRGILTKVEYTEIKLQRAIEVSKYQLYIEAIAENDTSLALHDVFKARKYEKIFNSIKGTTEKFDTDSAVKALHNGQYYSVTKMAQMLFDARIENNIKEHFFCLKSEPRKTKDGSLLCFVEVLYRGRRAKILIDITKHIKPSQKVFFDRLKQFDRLKYEKLSKALDDVDAFAVCITELADSKIPFSKATKQLDFVQYFILGNASLYYPEIEKALDSKSPPEKKVLKICNEALIAYIDFLYECLADSKKFDQAFNPFIEKIDIEFSKEFLNKAKDNLRASHFDPSLFMHNAEVRIVVLNYTLDNPSSTIPSHIEDSSLDALRLHKDRPLINVIGGSKYANLEAHESMYKIARGLMNVAHEYATNIAIPSTQAGLGLVMSKENILYREKHSKLSHHKKAHMFSIATGGNCFFPGNPFFSLEDMSGKYALSVADAIVTPYPADWGLDEKYIRNSRYFIHIAYMEALAARISEKNKHIIVLVNGGIFTLAELNQLIKRKATLVLLEDSGRFASVCSSLLNSLHEIPINNVSEFSEYVSKKVTSSVSPDIAQEFFAKDFGLQPYIKSTERQKLYRELFMSIIRVFIENKEVVRVANAETFESALSDLLK